MPDIPGNSSTTSSVSVGGTVSGTLETIGDHDWFRITLTAGQSITVFVDGTTLEDPYLYIRNSAGQLLYDPAPEESVRQQCQWVVKALLG